jgi:hypothetical protein
MRQRTYGDVGSPAREGGLTRLYSQYLNLGLCRISKKTPDVVLATLRRLSY